MKKLDNKKIGVVNKSEYFFDGFFVRKIKGFYMSEKGGIRQEDFVKKDLRDMPLNNYFRESVKTRDGFRCLKCGIEKEKGLWVVRDKPFTKVCERLGVVSPLQALVCKELWDIGKAKTMCAKCAYHYRVKA